MKIKKRSNLDVGMSFLDVISCGFGAVIMLVIIAKDSKFDTVEAEPFKPQAKTSSEAQFKTKIKNLENEINNMNRRKHDLEIRLTTLAKEIKDAEISSIELEKKASIRSHSNINSIESIYAGGIPVEREYVVFILDTSGSMKRFWSTVEKQIDAILSIHPKVKGIQIMNDSGDYLFQGYSSRWIPDTQITRQRISEKLREWNSFSNSNPAKGLEKALRFHSNVPGGVSIYVMGDDFTGPSYDDVITRIQILNQKKDMKYKSAQIHGIAFPWGVGDRFSTLMRELALRNDGVLVTVHFPLQYGRN
tara:strand:+ start:446 stop:1357 length:912 start_codon:yes stop_codon:yes gene_type:complete